MSVAWQPAQVGSVTVTLEPTSEIWEFSATVGGMEWDPDQMY